MEPPPRFPKLEKTEEIYVTPIEKLNNYGNSLGVNFLLDLGRRLRALDKQKENRLYLEDFIATVKEMNLLNNADAEEIFGDIDIHKNGYVALDEFIKSLRAPIPKIRKAAIEDAVNKTNTNDDGLIPIEDLAEYWDGTVQNYLGEDATAEERKEKFLYFLTKDAEYDECVTKEELTNFHWIHSAMTNDDADFVLTLRQAYHLD